MSKTDFLHILPLFILTSAAILILFSIAVKRNHKVIYVITTVSLAADFCYLALYKAAARWVIEPLFVYSIINLTIGLIHQCKTFTENLHQILAYRTVLV